MGTHVWNFRMMQRMMMVMMMVMMGMVATTAVGAKVVGVLNYDGECVMATSSSFECVYKAESQSLNTLLSSTASSPGISGFLVEPLHGEGEGKGPWSVMHHNIEFLPSGGTYEYGNVTFAASSDVETESATTTLFFSTFSIAPGITISPPGSPQGIACGAASYNITGGVGVYDSLRGALTNTGCVTPAAKEGLFDASFLHVFMAHLP